MDTLDLPSRIAGLMGQARSGLAELVAMKSVADPRLYPVEECHRAAGWVLDQFASVGFVDLELKMMSDGSQAVVGQRRTSDPGAPTVLLYAHYDVQPPVDERAWRTPPFLLTEVGGRWYGRGAADCKGNILMHLTALRALGAECPVNLKLVVAGAEEQATGGLEDFVPRHADLLRADAVLVGDTGNPAVGVPAVTVSLRGAVNVVIDVQALGCELHSGRFGGAAPDALAALIHMLATLRDAGGNTTIDGLDNTQVWDGDDYPSERFRAAAQVLDGVSLLSGGRVADLVWARPAVTVLGIDCPSAVGSATVIQPSARAWLNLRTPPGLCAEVAAAALAAHLQAVAPWGVRATVETDVSGAPFQARTGGPAYASLEAALERAYRRDVVALGQGGSIPLCNVLADTFPSAEILLLGVQDPLCGLHAPNESVDPTEIERIALAEGLFLQHYASAW